MIFAEQISKIYKTKNEDVKAVNEISLFFEDRGMYALIGKSGSGKTTLLNLLAGLDKADFGEIRYRWQDRDIILNELTDEELDSFHNLNMGFVFQEYNLIDDWSVLDNIQIVLQQNSMCREDEYSIKINEVLEYVGISELRNRNVSELSGGQAQRVAIARALVKHPSIIFADEPTGNLDSRSAQQVLELLKKISKQCLVVLVTHDEHAALSYADKIIELKDGKILSQKDMTESKLHKLTLLNMDEYGKKEFVSRSVREISNHFFEFLSGNLGKKYVVEYSCKEDGILNSDMSWNDRISVVKKINEKSLIRYAIKSLGGKKGRSILSVLIVGIVLCFLQILMSVAVADIGRSMAWYLKNNEIEEIYLQQTLSYENSFYEKENVTRGDSVEIKTYVNNFEEKQNVYRACLMIPVLSSKSDALVTVYTDTQNRELLRGNYPKERDEVCITDFVTYLLGLNENCIGEEIYLHELKFKISGVIKTDYKTSGFLNRFSKGTTNLKDGYNLKYYYASAVCRSEFDKYLQENLNFLDIKAANFVIDTERYLDSFCRYASLEQCEEKLICGRYPEKEKEVIVSYSFAENNNLMTEEGNLIQNSFLYQDIYDPKYNDAYEGDINLYNHIQQIQVVGIAPDNENEIDIWIDDKVYCDIENHYYGESIYNLFYLDIHEMNDQEMRQTINSIYEKGICIDEPGAIDISNVYSMKQGLLSVIIVLIIIIAVLILWLCRVFVYHEVIREKRKIGILRALGVNKKTLVKIFSYEVCINSMVSLLLSVGFSMCGMEWFNEILNRDKEIQIVYFFQSEWMIMMVMVCFVGLSILNVIEAIVETYDKPIVSLLK